MFAWSWRNWNPYILLIGMENSAATLEKTVQEFQKMFNVELLSDPAIPLVDI